MKKRVLSILLVLSMILTLLPTTVFAAVEEESAEFYAECTVDGVQIKAYAPEGVLPKGSTLSVSSVDGARATQRVNKAVDKVRDEGRNVEKTYILDFVFRNAKGMEIEPNGDVQLFFVADGVSSESVYHIKQSWLSMTAEPMETEEVAGGCLVNAEEFSYYVIQFTYGDSYRFANYEGIPLYDVLLALGIEPYDGDYAPNGIKPEDCGEGIEPEYIVSSDTDVVDVYYSYETFNADSNGEGGWDGWIVVPISKGAATLSVGLFADENDPREYRQLDISVAVDTENESKTSTGKDLTELPPALKGVKDVPLEYHEDDGHETVTNDLQMELPEHIDDISYDIYKDYYAKAGRVDGTSYLDDKDYQAFVNSVLDLFCMTPEPELSDVVSELVKDYGIPALEEVFSEGEGDAEEGEEETPKFELPKFTTKVSYKSKSLMSSFIGAIDKEPILRAVATVLLETELSNLEEGFIEDGEEEEEAERLAKEAFEKKYPGGMDAAIEAKVAELLETLPDDLSCLTLPWTMNDAKSYYDAYYKCEEGYIPVGVSNLPANLKFVTLNSTQLLPFTAVVDEDADPYELPVTAHFENGKLYTNYGCVVEGAYHPYSLNLPVIREQGFAPGAGNPAEELGLDSSKCLLDPMDETELKVVYGCVYCYYDGDAHEYKFGYDVLGVSNTFKFSYQAPAVEMEDKEITVYEGDKLDLLDGINAEWHGTTDVTVSVGVEQIEKLTKSFVMPEGTLVKCAMLGYLEGSALEKSFRALYEKLTAADYAALLNGMSKSDYALLLELLGKKPDYTAPGFKALSDLEIGRMLVNGLAKDEDKANSFYAVLADGLPFAKVQSLLNMLLADSTYGEFATSYMNGCAMSSSYANWAEMSEDLLSQPNDAQCVKSYLDSFKGLLSNLAIEYEDIDYLALFSDTLNDETVAQIAATLKKTPNESDGNLLEDFLSLMDIEQKFAELETEQVAKVLAALDCETFLKLLDETVVVSDSTYVPVFRVLMLTALVADASEEEFEALVGEIEETAKADGQEEFFATVIDLLRRSVRYEENYVSVNEIDLKEVEDTENGDLYRVTYQVLLNNAYVEEQCRPLVRTVRVLDAGDAPVDGADYFYAPFSSGAAGQKYEAQWDKWVKDYGNSLTGSAVSEELVDLLCDQIMPSVADLIDLELNKTPLPLPITSELVLSLTDDLQKSLAGLHPTIPAIIYTDRSFAEGVNNGSIRGGGAGELLNSVLGLAGGAVGDLLALLPPELLELLDREYDAEKVELEEVWGEEDTAPWGLPMRPSEIAKLAKLVPSILSTARVPAIGTPYAFSESKGVFDEIAEHIYVNENGVKTKLNPEKVDVELVASKLLVNSTEVMAEYLAPEDEAVVPDPYGFTIPKVDSESVISALCGLLPKYAVEFMPDELLLSDEYFPDYNAPLDWDDLFSILSGEVETEFEAVIELLSDPDELLAMLSGNSNLDVDPNDMMEMLTTIIEAAIIGLDVGLLYEIVDKDTQEAVDTVRVNAKIYPQLDLVLSPYAQLDLSRQTVDNLLGMFGFFGEMGTGEMDPAAAIGILLGCAHLGIGGSVKLGDVTIPFTPMLQAVLGSSELLDINPIPGEPLTLRDLLAEEYGLYIDEGESLSDAVEKMGFGSLNPFAPVLKVEQGDTSFWLYQYLRYLRGEATAAETLSSDSVGLALAGLQRLRIGGGIGLMPLVSLEGELEAGVQVPSVESVTGLINEWLGTLIGMATGSDEEVDSLTAAAQAKLEDPEYIPSVIDRLYTDMLKLNSELNRGEIGVYVSGDIDVNNLGEYKITITPVLDGALAEDYAMQYTVQVVKPAEKNILFKVGSKEIYQATDEKDLAENDNVPTTPMYTVVSTNEENKSYPIYNEVSSFVNPYFKDWENADAGIKQQLMAENGGAEAAKEAWKDLHDEAVAQLKSSLAKGVSAKTEKNIAANVSVTLSKIDVTDVSSDITGEVLASKQTTDLVKDFGESGDEYYLITYKAVHPQDYTMVEKLYGILKIMDTSSAFYDETVYWEGTIGKNIEEAPLKIGVNSLTDTADIFQSSHIFARVLGCSDSEVPTYAVDEDTKVMETIEEVSIKRIYKIDGDTKAEKTLYDGKTLTNVDCVDKDDEGKAKPGTYYIVYSATASNGAEITATRQVNIVEPPQYDVAFYMDVKGDEHGKPGDKTNEQAFALGKTGWDKVQIDLEFANKTGDDLYNPEIVVHIPRGFKIAQQESLRLIGGGTAVVSKDGEGLKVVYSAESVSKGATGSFVAMVDLETLYKDLTQAEDPDAVTYEFTAQVYCDGMPLGDCSDKIVLKPKRRFAQESDYAVIAGEQKFATTELFLNKMTGSATVSKSTDPEEGVAPYVISVTKTPGTLPKPDWNLQFKLPEQLTQAAYDDKVGSYPYVLSFYYHTDPDTKVLLGTRTEVSVKKNDSGVLTVPLYSDDRYSFNKKGLTYMDTVCLADLVELELRFAPVPVSNKPFIVNSSVDGTQVMTGSAVNLYNNANDTQPVQIGDQIDVRVYNKAEAKNLIELRGFMGNSALTSSSWSHGYEPEQLPEDEYSTTGPAYITGGSFAGHALTITHNGARSDKKGTYWTDGEWNIYSGMKMTVEYPYEYSPISGTFKLESYDVTYTIKDHDNGDAVVATELKYDKDHPFMLQTLNDDGETVYEPLAEEQYVSSVTFAYRDSVIRNWKCDHYYLYRDAFDEDNPYAKLDNPQMYIRVRTVDAEKQVQVKTTLSADGYESIQELTQYVNICVGDEPIVVYGGDRSGSEIPVGRNAKWNSGGGSGFAVNFDVDSNSAEFDEETYVVLTGEALPMVDFTKLNDNSLENIESIKIVAYSVDSVAANSASGPWAGEETGGKWFWAEDEGFDAEFINGLADPAEDGTPGQMLTGVIMDVSGLRFGGRSKGNGDYNIGYFYYDSKPLWSSTPFFTDVVAEKMTAENDRRYPLSFHVGLHTKDMRDEPAHQGEDGLTKVIAGGLVASELVQTNKNTNNKLDPFSGGANYQLNDMELVRVGVLPNEGADKFYGSHQECSTVFTATDEQGVENPEAKALLSLVQGVSVLTHTNNYGGSGEEPGISSIEYTVVNSKDEPETRTAKPRTTYVNSVMRGKGEEDDVYKTVHTDAACRYGKTGSNLENLGCEYQYIYYVPFALESGEYVTEIKVNWTEVSTRLNFPEIGLVRVSQLPASVSADVCGEEVTLDATDTLPVYAKMSFISLGAPVKIVKELDSAELGDSANTTKTLDKFEVEGLFTDIDGNDAGTYGTGTTIKVHLKSYAGYEDAAARVGSMVNGVTGKVNNGAGDPNFNKLKHTVYYVVDKNIDIPGTVTTDNAGEYLVKGVEAKNAQVTAYWYPDAYAESVGEQTDGILKLVYGSYCGSSKDDKGNIASDDEVTIPLDISYDVQGETCTPIKMAYLDISEDIKNSNSNSENGRGYQIVGVYQTTEDVTLDVDTLDVVKAAKGGKSEKLHSFDMSDCTFGVFENTTDKFSGNPVMKVYSDEDELLETKPGMLGGTIATSLEEGKKVAFGIETEVVTTYSRSKSYNNASSKYWNIYIPIPKAGSEYVTGFERNNEPKFAEAGFSLALTGPIDPTALNLPAGTKVYYTTEYDDSYVGLFDEDVGDASQYATSPEDGYVTADAITNGAEPGSEQYLENWSKVQAVHIYIPEVQNSFKLNLEFAPISGKTPGDQATTANILFNYFWEPEEEGAQNVEYVPMCLAGEFKMTQTSTFVLNDYYISGTVMTNEGLNVENGLFAVQLLDKDGNELTYVDENGTTQWYIDWVEGGQYKIGAPKTGVYQLKVIKAPDEEFEYDASEAVATVTVESGERTISGVDFTVKKTEIYAEDFSYSTIKNPLTLDKATFLANAYVTIGDKKVKDAEMTLYYVEGDTKIELTEDNLASILEGAGDFFDVLFAYHNDEKQLQVEQAIMVCLREKGSELIKGKDYITAQDFTAPASYLSASTARRLAYAAAIDASGKHWAQNYISVNSDELADINDAINEYLLTGVMPEEKEFPLTLTTNGGANAASITVTVTLSENDRKKGTPLEKPYVSAKSLLYKLTDEILEKNGNDTEYLTMDEFVKESGLYVLDQYGYATNNYSINPDTLVKLNTAIENHRPGTYRVEITVPYGEPEQIVGLKVPVTLVDYFYLAFHPNNGKATQYVKVRYGDSYAIPDNTLTRSDEAHEYSFEGWAITERGGAIYSDGIELTKNALIQIYNKIQSNWLVLQNYVNGEDIPETIWMRFMPTTEEQAFKGLDDLLAEMEAGTTSFNKDEQKALNKYKALRDLVVYHGEGEERYQVYDLYAVWNAEPGDAQIDFTVKGNGVEEGMEVKVTLSENGMIKKTSIGTVKNGEPFKGSFTQLDGGTYTVAMTYGIKKESKVIELEVHGQETAAFDFDLAAIDKIYTTSVADGLPPMTLEGFEGTGDPALTDAEKTAVNKDRTLGATVTLKATKSEDAAEQTAALTKGDTTVSTIVKLGVYKTIRYYDENGFFEYADDEYEVTGDTELTAPVKVTIPYSMPNGVFYAEPTLYCDGEEMTKAEYSDDMAVGKYAVNEEKHTVVFFAKTFPATYALTLTAKRVEVEIPTPAQNEFTYTGSAFTFDIPTKKVNYTFSGDELTQTEVGTYTVTLALKDALNYEWVGDTDTVKDDGTIDYTFTINPIPYKVTVAAEKVGTADGSVKITTNTCGVYNNVSDTEYDVLVYKTTQDVTVEATEVGAQSRFTAWMLNDEIVSTEPTYTFKPIKLMSESGTIALKAMFVDKTPVTIPTAEPEENRVYNGNPITGVKVEEGANYTLEGTSSAINAGTYTVTAKLTDETQYIWADGTTGDKDIEWTISKKTQDAPAVKGKDGKITGVTSGLEYKRSGDNNWTQIKSADIKDGEITVLPGVYYVRTAAGDEQNYNPSTIVTVNVGISVLTIQPSDPGETKATFYGSVTPFLQITEEGFVYRVKPETPNDDWSNCSTETVKSTSEQFSKQVTGLKAGTAYEVRAYAKMGGNTYYGKVATVITLAKKTSTINVDIANETDKDVSISIEKGNEVVASIRLRSGVGTFNGLDAGYYNIVVRTTDGAFTDTHLVEIKDTGEAVFDAFEIPEGKLATVVEVKESTTEATDDEGKKLETPAVAVNGLSEILTEEEKEAAASGTQSIEVRLEVERKVDIAATDTVEEIIQTLPTDAQEAITAIVAELPETGEQTTMFLDMSLYKTTTEFTNGAVTSSDTENIGKENEQVIEIAVPYDTSKEPVVYRFHDSQAKLLDKVEPWARPTSDSYVDGTYFFKDGYVFIYAKGFSMYALSYNVYDVTFYTCADDVTVAPVKVDHGQTFDKPTDPKREGYDFDGWFKEESCENEWNFETDTVTSNVDLYAKWTPIDYTVTNGTTDTNGTVTVDGGFPATKHVGDEVIVTVTPNTGYALDTLKYNDGTSDTTITADAHGVYGFYMIAKDVTITATFAVKTYAVTLNTNGGTCTPLTSYSYGTGVPQLPKPTKDGYVFDGWFVSPEFSGSAVTAITTSETGDKTFYAKWTQKLTKPTAAPKTYTYNGAEQSFELNGFDANGMNISNNKKTNAGTYTVTVTLKDGFEWRDDGPCEFTWTIEPMALDQTTVTVDDIADQQFTANPIEPELTVMRGIYTLEKDTDYTVVYTNNVGPTAEATATINFCGNYTGSVEKTFAITLFANSVGAATAKINGAAEAKTKDGGTNDQMLSYISDTALSAPADPAHPEIVPIEVPVTFTYTYQVTEDTEAGPVTTTVTLTGPEAAKAFKAADEERIDTLVTDAEQAIATLTDPANIPGLENMASMTPEQILAVVEGVRGEIEAAVKQTMIETVAEINSGNMTTTAADTTPIETIQNREDRHPNTTVNASGLPTVVGDMDPEDEAAGLATNLSEILINAVTDDVDNIDQYTALLTANPANDENQIKAIEAKFGSNTRIIEVYDFCIELFRNGDFQNYIYDANGLLVVKIDYDIEGKEDFQIYRYHDYGDDRDPVDVLTTTRNAYGEYIEYTDDGIEMHVRFFCTYALAYDEHYEPSQEDTKTFSGKWYFGSQEKNGETHVYGETGYDKTAFSFSFIKNSTTVTLTSTLYPEFNGTHEYKIVKDGVVRIMLSPTEEINAVVKEENNKQYLVIELSDDETITLEKNPKAPGGGDGPSGGGSGMAVTEKFTVKCGAGVTVDKTEAAKGTKITVTLADGYKNVVVKDADGNAVTVSGNTFLMPESNVTVTATAIEAGACPQDATCVYAKFTDAKTAEWYHDGVHFCVENGYMNGVAETQFAPNGTLSRAMIVTMLWRMAGSPVVNYAMSFSDVADGQWYTEAIRWAQSTGVVTGYDAERFGPNDSITREQLASILMRYAAFKGIDVSEQADLAKFDDAASISGWALEGVKWANAAGIINGRTETTIAPVGNATRAEAAAMVQRFCETVLSK